MTYVNNETFWWKNNNYGKIHSRVYALDLKVISSNNNQLFKHCIYQDNGVRMSLYVKTNSKNLVVNQYCGYKKYLHSKNKLLLLYEVYSTKSKVNFMEFAIVWSPNVNNAPNEFNQG